MLVDIVRRNQVRFVFGIRHKITIVDSIKQLIYSHQRKQCKLNAWQDWVSFNSSCRFEIYGWRRGRHMTHHSIVSPNMSLIKSTMGTQGYLISGSCNKSGNYQICIAFLLCHIPSLMKTTNQMCSWLGRYLLCQMLFCLPNSTL